MQVRHRPSCPGGVWGLYGVKDPGTSTFSSRTPRLLPVSCHPNDSPPYPQCSPWKRRKGTRRGSITSFLGHVLEVAFISSTHPISHHLATWSRSTLKKAGNIMGVRVLRLKCYYSGRRGEQTFGDDIRSASSSALCVHRHSKVPRPCSFPALYVQAVIALARWVPQHPS